MAGIKYAAYPIDRPHQNDIYLADWGVSLPAFASAIQSLAESLSKHG
jgi:hypothetical protein